MGKKLFVGGLPWSVTDAELKAAFEPIGPVMEAKVINDRETGRSRGFGFVTMSTDADAEKAIKQMDGALMGPRTINVNEAQERSGGGGGGGGPRSGGAPRGGGGGGGGGGRYEDDRGGRRDRGSRRDKW